MEFLSNYSEQLFYTPTPVSMQADLDETTFVGVETISCRTRAVESTPPTRRTRRDLLPTTVGDVLAGQHTSPILKKVWLATNGGGCSGDVLALRVSPSYRDRMLPEFLYYLLSSDDFFTYEMQYAKGAKMPRGDKASILRYRIPVPPVEVQREIVRVLDLFGGPTADLVTQLERGAGGSVASVCPLPGQPADLPRSGGRSEDSDGRIRAIIVGAVTSDIESITCVDHGGELSGLRSSQSRQWSRVFG